MSTDGKTRTLVTGGAGFIGSHLTERLLRGGRAVTVVDDESTGNRENLSAVITHPQLRYVKGSIGDDQILDQVLDDVDQVYHLAAAVGVALIARDPISTIEANINPTQRLLARLCQQVQRGQAVRFFLTSSSEVYGKNTKPVWDEEDDLVLGPTSRARWSYGAAKAIDEFLAMAYWKQFGLPIVIGRLFNVVGPRQSGAYGMVLPRFIAAAVANQPLVVHDDGHQERCFAHVEDVIEAMVALADCPQAVGRVFNIGSDRPVRILDLARQVIAQARSRSIVVHQSYAEAYGDDFEDTRRRVPDLSRLRQTVEFSPRHELPAIIEQLLALAGESITMVDGSLPKMG